MTLIPGYRRLKTYISTLDYDQDIVIPSGRSIQFNKNMLTNANPLIYLLKVDENGLQFVKVNESINKILSFNISQLDETTSLFENNKINSTLYDSSSSGLPEGLSYSDGILKVSAGKLSGNSGLVVENLLKISNLDPRQEYGTDSNLVLEKYGAEYLGKEEDEIVVNEEGKDGYGVIYTLNSNTNTCTLHKFPENIGFYSTLHPYTIISKDNQKYSLIGIDDNAGMNCTSLNFVGLPSSVTKIGKNAFENCSSLISLDFSKIESLEIDTDAFSGCTNCTISILSSLETILHDRITNDKIDDASITIIPHDFVYVDETGYDSTSTIKYILNDENNTCTANSCENQSSVVNWTPYTRVYCKTTDKIYEIIEIGNKTFRNKLKLKINAIPYSVTNIGDEAFYLCTSLNYIDCTKLSTVTIGKNAFHNCTQFYLTFKNDVYNSLKEIGRISSDDKIDSAYALIVSNTILFDESKDKNIKYLFNDKKKEAILEKYPKGYKIPKFVINTKTNKKYKVIVKEKRFLW